jgi:hypothetical protein
MADGHSSSGVLVSLNAPVGPGSSNGTQIIPEVSPTRKRARSPTPEASQSRLSSNADDKSFDNLSDTNSGRNVRPKTIHPYQTNVINNIDSLLKNKETPVYSYKDPEWGTNEPIVVYSRCAEEADELIGALSG